jgi:hypothetical protein
VLNVRHIRLIVFDSVKPMIRTTQITNRTKAKKLLFVEPEAFDYWLQPEESAELRAEVKSANSNFEFSITEKGITVFPCGDMGSIWVYSGRSELMCGYQRPDDWK